MIITAQITGLLKELADLGFNPLSAVLMAGIIFLGGYMKITLAIQNQLRENWHNDTRQIVAEAKVEIKELQEARKGDARHILECDKDRQALHEQVKKLVEQMDDYQRCPMGTCPFRTKPVIIP